MRWLVADVPRRVEVDVGRRPIRRTARSTLHVRVSDAEYLPLDNAQVDDRSHHAGRTQARARGRAGDDEAGAYQATHVPRQPGAYRATVTAKAADGSAVGEREAGWVAQPAADEFNNLQPNRAALEEIAAKTGGEVIEIDDLESLRRRVCRAARHRSPSRGFARRGTIRCFTWRSSPASGRVGPATLEGAGVNDSTRT